MLRRLLCFLSVIALILGLSGCGAAKVPLKIESFACDVKFQSAGTQIKGEITYNSPEDISLKIKEPENIKGIEFKADNKNMQVAVSEVSFSTNANQDSPVYELFDILQTLAQSETDVSLKGEEEITLSHGDKQYRVMIDCEDKRPLFAETENCGYIFE